MHRRQLKLLAVLMWMAASLSLAQNSKFEVVSIKPNNSGQGPTMLGGPDLANGKFNGRNVPVRTLIQFAYNVQDFLISGGPGWMNSDRFDIQAKAEGPLTVEQARVMVQAMLE